jgi:hypothetical protein
MLAATPISCPFAIALLMASTACCVVIVMIKVFIVSVLLSH